MTLNEYKKFKNLKGENLRDHMTNLELIVSMLGDASTTKIERVKDPKKLMQHIQSFKDGGIVAKNARLELETKTGKNVVTNKNSSESLKKQGNPKKLV